MKLVIAEKPSVAMSLAAVLGANEKKDGYMEGGGLPILPEEWKYEVPKDKKKQLDLLCRLMKDKRVESVVCATDVG